MKNTITGLFLLLTWGIVSGQVPGTVPTTSSTADLPNKVAASMGEVGTKGNAKISGYIVDSTLTKAVEFANVALYTTLTNKLVDGTVADE